MLEYAWARFLVASFWIAWWEFVDWIAHLASRGARPPGPPVPRWTRFVGFASVTFFYVVLGREGGPVLGGRVNDAAFLIAGIALGLRWFTRRGTRRVRYPHMTARILFFAALPLGLGAPHAWVALTLPQAILAVAYALRADAVLARSANVADQARLAESHRIVPGLW